MVLVDTSAWIDFFANRQPLASRVDATLVAGDSAIAGPVITELRRGLRPLDRARVLRALRGCAALAQPPDLWERAGDLGAALARRGRTVKTLDLLIAVYAIEHRALLLTGDADFRVIAAHTPSLRLA